jgi:hypothetical protein
MTADQVAEQVLKALLRDPVCQRHGKARIEAAIEEELRPIRVRDATTHEYDGQQVRVAPYSFNAAAVLSFSRKVRRRIGGTSGA